MAMTRFDFLDRYKLFIPQTHAALFERDLYDTIHHEAWVERMGEEEPQQLQR